jgi:hypothetical protein
MPGRGHKSKATPYAYTHHENHVGAVESVPILSRFRDRALARLGDRDVDARPRATREPDGRCTRDEIVFVTRLSCYEDEFKVIGYAARQNSPIQRITGSASSPLRYCRKCTAAFMSHCMQSRNACLQAWCATCSAEALYTLVARHFSPKQCRRCFGTTIQPRPHEAS